MTALPRSWPEKKPLAVSVSVMLEGWSDVNDMPLYVRYGSEPAAYSRIFERIVAHWRVIGGKPGCIDLTVHAHVFGRPFGLIELQTAIEAARRYP